MKISLKKFMKQTGVAMTEYAVLLAFVAAIGASFFSGNGLSNSITGAVSKAVYALNSNIKFVDKENQPHFGGTGSGKLDGRVGDWSGGANFSLNFNTEWNDVKVEVKPTLANNFILLHVVNYVGDVYIKNIKFEGYEGQTRPLTQEDPAYRFHRRNATTP